MNRYCGRTLRVSGERYPHIGKGKQLVAGIVIAQFVGERAALGGSLPVLDASFGIIRS